LKLTFSNCRREYNRLKINWKEITLKYS
jgi:hypothetical protein